MSPSFIAAVLSLGVIAASMARAADGAALASSAQCIACHAVDSRVVGPSFKEIAVKYKSSPNAADRLAASVREGSQGKWGSTPMPPNASVNDADARTLAAWILSQ
ncbi:c-type cytochrome [Variovorax sp. Sphag1AA]|uniref:c-type cytochrome n=1 Tax=Variovorax sp. Sphag1AA TaxID=2587027 RepID=UPI00161FFCC1|nr:c-type cytochrome [Variovorax sp. Sphag1AA]MBB3178769.1 cytochrome c [Variovorax sp. Sphag1AA]